MQEVVPSPFKKRLTKRVDFFLSILDGFLYVDTPVGKYRVNDIQLRYDGNPRKIMEYLIDQKPGRTVTLEDIKHSAKIPSSQDLRRLMWKVGLTGVLKYAFVELLEKDVTRIRTNITLPRDQATFVIDELYRRSSTS